MTEKSLQKSHFQSHAAAICHRAAVSDPQIRMSLLAPPVNEFVEALQLVRQGKCGGDQGTGAFKRQQLVKVKYCLAEALRCQTRLKLWECNCLTLHSDASKARLVLRAQGCGMDLAPLHALLGCEKLSDFDAQGIARCIMSMLADICTPFKHAETLEHFKGLPPNASVLDRALLSHLFSIVEVFNADAAPDEQLAGQMFGVDVRGGNLAEIFTSEACPGAKLAMEVNMESFSQIFPNLKVINKDKPHAARRIVSRTWKCDHVLNGIVKKVFMSSDSIVQQIHFSDVMRQMYGNNVRAMQYTPLWKEMSEKFSAAKHRFDSWSMPFAKVCLTLDAVIRTAQSAHEERKNEKVGRAGRTFLDLLSEETVILMGMLADAGEENLQLTRRLDSETTTSGSLAVEVQQFVIKLNVLFRQGAVVKTGYTAHVLSLLEKPRTLYIDKKAKRLGGLPRQQLAVITCNCLKRFASWVALAQEVVATEFPAFEILQSMSIFHLTPLNERISSCHKNFAMEEKDKVAKLGKIAAVLGIDEEALSLQFADYLAVAQHKFDAAGDLQELPAWKSALDTCFRDKRLQKSHPQKELREVLSRAFGWGCSTSGVEQAFSGIRSLVASKGRMTEIHLRDEIFLLSTQGWNQSQDLELAQVAAMIWSEIFGPVRSMEGCDSTVRSVAAKRAWRDRKREGTWNVSWIVFGLFHDCQN